MNKEQEEEYQEHYSPDGERLEYLMEHPEENDLNQTNKEINESNWEENYPIPDQPNNRIREEKIKGY